MTPTFESPAKYSAWLESELTEPYSHTHSAGHDVWHVKRMVLLGERIAKILDFDWDEFVAAVWLHNLDRVPAYRLDVEAIGFNGVVRNLLKEGPFDAEAQERITIAAVTHGKKDDEPGDSTVLQALRIADKLDRLTPLGVLCAAMIHGHRIPLYDPEDPFGYESTEYDRLRTVYNDFFRLLEWVDMLPSDEARSLIDRAGLRALIDFIRALAADISNRHNVPNNAEDDIRKALGRHYETYAV